MRHTFIASAALVAATLASSSSFNRVQAQLAKQGTPPSESVEELGEVPAFVLTQPDIAAMKKADLTSDGPYRFGAVISTALSSELHGRWDEVPSSTDPTGVQLVWRLEITSPGAYSLGLLFGEYELPEGGQLFVYSPDRSYTLGAFDASNRQPNGMLAVSPVPGDRIIIEYTQGLSVEGTPSLRVVSVVHDYRNVFNTNPGPVSSLDMAPVCAIDINCPEGDNYQDVKRAVVRLFREGVNCTGVLLNNNDEDSTPYMMTSVSCGNMANAIIVFDYENTTCAGGGASLASTISGASIVVENSGINNVMWELSSTPPESFDPFYAGWTRTTNPQAPGVSISHPSGDPKKIAVDDEKPANIGGQWQATWEDGNLDSGSFGSPLLDPRGRVVGTAVSNMTIASCSVQTTSYARFNQFWNQSGLGTWLDPQGKNPVGLVGLDPFAPLAVAYNGSGANPNVFTSNLPAIGTTFVGTVDTSGHPGAVLTSMIVYTGQSSGTITKFGELLVDLGSSLESRTAAGVSANISTHSLPIPNDPMFRGLVGYCQTAIVGGGYAELTNAIKVRVN